MDAEALRAHAHAASYRDPGARVLEYGGRLLRGLDANSAGRYRGFVKSGLAERLIARSMLVPTWTATDVDPQALDEPWSEVLEHERLAFVSYPYEWPFALLQRAALLHLDVQLEALDTGFALADATAYNVQFRGVRPVFIDVGSFRPYVEGELWAAHRQFCEHFLHPLLLAAELGIPYQPWLRGSLEGIPSAAMAALLPARRWMSLRHVVHVLLPARAEGSVRRAEERASERIRRAKLPRDAFAMLLRQLRSWIAGLAPRGADRTTWADYHDSRSYDASETARKRAFIAQFAAQARPRQLWDFGCNDGEFCEVAIRAGAASAVGFDADEGALQRACERADRGALDFLPLWQDAVDPSPARGWRLRERSSLLERGAPDAVMALAFLHHVVLGRNVPLDEAVGFLTGVAPRGVIEFVPKADPMVQRMLALKGDIFPGYDEPAFEAALARHARLVRRETISSTGRALFEFGP